MTPRYSIRTGVAKSQRIIAWTETKQEAYDLAIETAFTEVSVYVFDFHGREVLDPSTIRKSASAHPEYNPCC